MNGFECVCPRVGSQLLKRGCVVFIAHLKKLAITMYFELTRSIRVHPKTPGNTRRLRQNTLSGAPPEGLETLGPGVFGLTRRLRVTHLRPTRDSLTESHSQTLTTNRTPKYLG